MMRALQAPRHPNPSKNRGPRCRRKPRPARPGAVVLLLVAGPVLPVLAIVLVAEVLVADLPGKRVRDLLVAVQLRQASLDGGQGPVAVEPRGDLGCLLVREFGVPQEHPRLEPFGKNLWVDGGLVFVPGRLHVLDVLREGSRGSPRALVDQVVELHVRRCREDVRVPPLEVLDDHLDAVGRLDHLVRDKVGDVRRLASQPAPDFQSLSFFREPGVSLPEEQLALVLIPPLGDVLAIP